MAGNIGFLLNNDQEAGLDKEAILADMDAIADEVGDWKDHIPYEAAIDFYSDDAVREMYSDHLDGCQFCKEMLETLNPSEKILGNLHRVREVETVWSQPRKAHLWAWSMSPSVAIAASAVLALFAGMFFGNPFEDWMPDETRFVVESIGTDRGALGQNSPPKSVENYFAAARFSLDNGSERLAYAQMASGFDIAGLDEQFVNAVNIGPAFAGDFHSRADVMNALAELGEKPTVAPDDVLDAIRLYASIGNDRGAIESIAQYLELYADQPRTLAAFETLVLERQTGARQDDLER